MALNQIHKNDVGIVLTMTFKNSGTALDVSSADTTTSRILVFKDSDGNLDTQTANLLGTGSTGVMTFTTTSSEFNTTGAWELQAKVTLGTTTSVFHSDIIKFDVLKIVE